MGILSGIVSYLFGLTLNLLDASIDGFLGALGFDLDTFEAYFPAAKDYYDVIIGFAVGLLFIMLIFQIFRNFGVVLDIEAEEPLKLLGKTALFYGMIINSRSITNIVLNLLTDPYSIFLNASSDPYEFRLMALVTSMFTSVFSNPFMAVVALVLMLVLGWQFLKLTVECVERYIVFYFVIYCAPVVFATGAFKSTAQIFKSWCRMLASQSLLLLLNIWSIKLFLSFLPVLEDDVDNIIFNFLLGYAFLKFAQKADTLLRILGLNTASTGDMVRSLGGTIASVAFTIKSMSGMAGSVASAAGKLFGGGAAAAAGATAGAAAGGAVGSAVSGMAGGMAGFASKVAGVGSSSPDNGGGDSGINSVKRRYANDVLNSAKSKMSGNSENVADMTDTKTRGNGTSRILHGGIDGRTDSNSNDRNKNPNNIPDTLGNADRNIEMRPDGTRSSLGNAPRIDAETKEGLSNIAHGIPHDKYNPVKKSWSGGGFPEFTGQNANMIGTSELMPADGFEQHGVKMRDGSMGTLYENNETGESHLVQFGSVDNGVIQGTISEVDRNTGQLGDFMSFKAVHQSVPGAESFSGHSVSVSDGAGSAYHVSTGAATSFFAPGNSSTMTGSASVNTAPHAGASVSPASPPTTAVSQADTVTGSMGNTSSPQTPVSAQETDTVHTVMSGNNASGTVSDSTGAHQSNSHSSETPSEPSINTTVSHESVNMSSQSDVHPPVNSGMQSRSDTTRRYSRNHPKNLEVFKREKGVVESFHKTGTSSNTIPKMDSSSNKNT